MDGSKVLAELTLRAPRPGEGDMIAGLHEEMGYDGEAWGRPPGVRGVVAQAQLATSLDWRAWARAGRLVDDDHVHVVAVRDGRIVGQVEGWMDVDRRTCEVRSLVVHSEARLRGVGRALIDALARAAAAELGDGPTNLEAEVLEPNPARAFYRRLGFVEATCSARIAPSTAAATPQGELEVCARPGAGMIELSVISPASTTCATARLTMDPMTPPFLSGTRAILNMISLDPMIEPVGPLSALLSTAGRLALVRGAAALDLAGLLMPPNAIRAAALAAGAQPLTRVLVRPLRACAGAGARSAGPVDA